MTSGVFSVPTNPLSLLANRRRQGDRERDICRHGCGVAVRNRIGEASRPRYKPAVGTKLMACRTWVVADGAVARIAHPGDRQRQPRWGRCHWRAATKLKLKAWHSRLRKAPLVVVGHRRLQGGDLRRQHRPSSWCRYSCRWGRRRRYHRHRGRRRRSLPLASAVSDPLVCAVAK